MKKSDIDYMDYFKSVSSAEVVTPASVADMMASLIDKSILKNPNSTYLCATSKDGKITRAVAKLLDKMLSDVISDAEERMRHIFHNQIFSTATSPLAAEATRQALYLFQKANDPRFRFKFDNPKGNVRYIKELDAYDGCNNKKLLKKAFKRDSFDVIIGNPPYHEGKAFGKGNTTSKAVFAKYILNAIDLNPKQLLTMCPAKWETAQKYELFRERLSNGRHVYYIRHHDNASELFFSEVLLKGGVDIIDWRRGHCGDTRYVAFKDGKIVSDEVKPLVNLDCGIVLNISGADSIIGKVRSFKEDSFKNIVQPTNPYGLSTNFNAMLAEPFEGCVKVYANHNRIGYVALESIKRNVELIFKPRICCAKAFGNGMTKTDKLKPFCVDPYEASTMSYLTIGSFKDEKERNNALKYMQTKFFHFLLGILKRTQDCSRYVFGLIPMQDFSVEWTDEMLYEKYGLTEDEIALIENSVWR